MKHYELLYLVSGNIPETQLDTIQAEVAGWITGGAGTITKQEMWGRKKLTYPIKKERHGFYLLFEFDGESKLIADLERKLRLNNTILRHMLIQKPVLSAKDILALETAKQKQFAAAEQRKVKEREKVAKDEESQAPDKDKAPKIKLEELDKKLDELLGSDMLK